MSGILISFFSIYIAVRDIREHKIYNRDLLAFALLLSIDIKPIAFRDIALCVTGTFCASMIFKVGGGDFKLLSLLFLTQGEIVASARYFSLLFFSLSAALFISAVSRWSLRGAVPLAPSLLLPFLVIYLDM